MSLLLEAPTSIKLLNNAVPGTIPLEWHQDFTPVPEVLGLNLRAERLDAIAFQKKRDWQARKSMVPQEVLKTAGIEDQAEIDFLLGISDKDPNPLNSIRFPKLVLGSVVITAVELDEIQPPIPNRKWIIREKGPVKQELKDALFGRPLTPLNDEQMGTLNKLSAFSSAILLALATASRDLETSERLAMEGKLDYGYPAIDHHPDRLPIYHRLIVAAKSPETPVFQS